uniref:E2F-associated phosphoprotein n=1 Tax=Rhabditophanes sp. KR3021 TaxID=114890 RepID=A0AC35U3U1_9BILA
MSKDNPLIASIDANLKEMLSEDVDFYDEQEDQDNQDWVENETLKRRGGEMCEEMKNVTLDGEHDLNEDAEKFIKSDFKTDAVLSCPLCLKIICRDCQRHAKFKEQYRAMFVENVEVDFDDVKYLPSDFDGNKVMQKTTVSESPENAFYPVQCISCKHKVAYMDNDEVYHFFDVLSGYS